MEYLDPGNTGLGVARIGPGGRRQGPTQWRDAVFSLSI